LKRGTETSNHRKKGEKEATETNHPTPKAWESDI